MPEISGDDPRTEQETSEALPLSVGNICGNCRDERRSPMCLSENMSGDTLLTQGGNNHYTSSSILDTSSNNILYNTRGRGRKKD